MLIWINKQLNYRLKILKLPNKFKPKNRLNKDKNKKKLNRKRRIKNLLNILN